MMVTTSTMNMTIFGPAYNTQAVIAFPTSGSTPGLLIHRQANWISTDETDRHAVYNWARFL